MSKTAVGISLALSAAGILFLAVAAGEAEPKMSKSEQVEAAKAVLDDQTEKEIFRACLEIFPAETNVSGLVKCEKDELLAAARVVAVYQKASARGDAQKVTRLERCERVYPLWQDVEDRCL